MGDISRNFSYSEFAESDTAKARGIDNAIKSDTVKRSIVTLVGAVLQPLHDAWGRTLKINSGYRCKELNAAVGGVPTSQHVKGEAADIAASNPYELASLARKLNLPFDQMILYPTFVHFSHKFNGIQRHQILYAAKYKGKRL